MIVEKYQDAKSLKWYVRWRLDGDTTTFFKFAHDPTDEEVASEAARLIAARTAEESTEVK